MASSTTFTSRKRASKPKTLTNVSRPLVRRIRRPRDLKRAYQIRFRVFVREQGVPPEMETDSEDAEAAHFLASVNGRAVGTARVVCRGGRAKIGRMAVLKSFRGRGAGMALLGAAVRWALERKARAVFLHAQLPVVGFYAKTRFVPVGHVFLEAGIPHRKMILRRPREAHPWVEPLTSERRAQDPRSP